MENNDKLLCYCDFKSDLIILAVNIIVSALLLVNNSPTCPNGHQTYANHYLLRLNSSTSVSPCLAHINHPQCILILAQRMHFLKKGGISYERICSVFGLQQADRAPSEMEYFHSSLTISTLLHVAIMRDKTLSNEQLHVVRVVPITNHCV